MKAQLCVSVSVCDWHRNRYGKKKKKKKKKKTDGYEKGVRVEPESDLVRK